MSRRQTTLYLASYLPWSREGTETFQMQRLRWVERLDHLIRIIGARGGYPAPILCEQTAPITDYLAFRPQNREKIDELVRGQQLQVGPWYVQPLDSLVGPESLLRNLMLGANARAGLGEPPDVAYLAPVSSHIAQMPQILRGFGIKTAIVDNGLAEPGSEFWWDAPDGSRVLLLRSQHNPPMPATARALEGALNIASRGLGRSVSGETLLLLTDFETNVPPIGDLIPLLQPSRASATVVHAGVATYASRVWQRDAPLPVVRGELNSPRYSPLSPGVLSTRMWLKQRNAAVEALLVRWAEPFAAWVEVLDTEEDFSSDGVRRTERLENSAQLIEHAWSILIRNHTAAPLSGASVDPAQKETDLLFDHAQEIGELVTRTSLSRLARAIDTAAVPLDKLIAPIVVFTGTAHSRSEVVSCEVALSPDVRGVEVVDVLGTILSVQVEGIEPGGPHREDSTQTKVRFLAQDLPGVGYATFAVRAAQDASPTPVTDEGLEVANTYFNVSLDPADGTLTLFDKRTGRSFAGLNRYVDSGDRGDAYLYVPPLRDTEISIPTNTPLHPQRLVGPLEQSLHVFEILRLPQALTSNREARLPLTAQFVPISIWTTIRLARDVPRVDVDVTVANAAADHRLEVHFPTGILTDEFLLDGHYELARRSVMLSNAGETAGWVEQPVPDSPHQGFVTVLGADSGLTIATRGLPNASVTATPYGCEIVITLLRCIGWLNRADLPNRRATVGPQIEIPGAQGVGEHRFAYSIIAHGPDPRPAWREAWAFRTPPRTVVTDIHNGPLPLAASLVECDSYDFILSAVKASQDRKALIVRGYSISDQPQTVVLRLGIRAKHAELLRLDESPTGAQLKVDRRRRITFEVQPAEIVTIRLIH